MTIPSAPSCTCTFRERSERHRGFKFLRVARQVVRHPMAGLQKVFGVGLRQHVPIREEMEVDLIPPQELVPGRATGRSVSTMAVEHQNIFESGPNHAVDQIGQDGQESSGLQ